MTRRPSAESLSGSSPSSSRRWTTTALAAATIDALVGGAIFVALTGVALAGAAARLPAALAPLGAAPVLAAAPIAWVVLLVECGAVADASTAIVCGDDDGVRRLEEMLRMKRSRRT